jgi:hypothetical protein
MPAGLVITGARDGGGEGAFEDFFAPTNPPGAEEGVSMAETVLDRSGFSSRRNRTPVPGFLVGFTEGFAVGLAEGERATVAVGAVDGRRGLLDFNATLHTYIHTTIHTYIHAYV